ncbi:hypothetical protein IG197_27000 [Aminobacter sp. SR38]|jgi:hypothetical protein|uniref:hypothetical protein n=1 Tax=unclassified Aminobacter TaxID=2644704 RepID=UPI0012B11AC6|nr:MULTISPECIES: hypothetical protein [unclassified Aminobacter]MRX31752.1 hypothetical protein [Aminobacter sp. MDW-2]QNH32232.1 hypothetical protein H5P29_16860 [Aminobacter sp. MDW-2]QOF71358.1 hypothetical protein IG197_27000 [Aminobacter sp. SR38]WMC94791.1 hypothetical protein RAR13_15435 [Aminobacter aminovorans]
MRIRSNKIPGRLANLILLAAFVTALVASGFFAIRLTVHAVYWSSHRDEPIEPWMTVGYVAHSYNLEPKALFSALDLPTGVSDRRTLGDIASAKGVSFEALKSTIEASIGRSRQQSNGGLSDRMSGS